MARVFDGGQDGDCSAAQSQSRTVADDVGHPEPSFRQENRPQGAGLLLGDARDETCVIDAPEPRLLLGRLHPCRAVLLFTGRQPDYARFPRYSNLAEHRDPMEAAPAGRELIDWQ